MEHIKMINNALISLWADLLPEPGYYPVLLFRTHPLLVIAILAAFVLVIYLIIRLIRKKK